MLTKLDVLQGIAALESEAEGYYNTKIALQRQFPKAQIKKQVRKLDAQYKKCGERVKHARHIIDILDNMTPETMRADRNNLLVKIRAIQDREPADEETNEKYTQEARKNPVIAKRIQAHYDMYKFDKLRKQYRALSLILRS